MQPPHEADVGLQAFHVECLPPAIFFDATDAIAELAASLQGSWLANVFVAHDRMQSSHEADMGLQAFHVKGLHPANFSALPTSSLRWQMLCPSCWWTTSKSAATVINAACMVTCFKTATTYSLRRSFSLGMRAP